MWIFQPVLNVIMFHVLEVISDQNITETKDKTVTQGSASSKGDTVCTVLNPLVYGIICFLAAMVFILIMLLFKVLSARHAINSHENRELNPVCPNDALLHVPPASVNDADDSSSTSSESHDGSIADVSSGSQRYVSLHDRRKSSDYINISEGASSAQADLKTEKTRKEIDYVNVRDPQTEIRATGQKNRDAETSSMSSDTSAESAVNYSAVVFTKM